MQVWAFLFEPVSSIRYKLACVYTKDSNHSAHPHSLIRALTLATHSVPLKDSLSDCAGAQADLSLRWAHMPACTFCWALSYVALYVEFRI